MRFAEQLRDALLGDRIHAERRQVQAAGLLVRGYACTTRSPWPDGSVETRTSTERPAILRLMRPSCGRRFSAMSSFDMTLMRETTERRDGAPALQDFAQHAVDAEAHHQAVLERLDVDVRGVFLHGLREHRVDEAG